MSSLLAYLNANEVISGAQTKKGFDRLYEVKSKNEVSHPFLRMKTPKY